MWQRVMAAFLHSFQWGLHNPFFPSIPIMVQMIKQGLSSSWEWKFRWRCYLTSEADILPGLSKTACPKVVQRFKTVSQKIDKVILKQLLLYKFTQFGICSGSDICSGSQAPPLRRAPKVDSGPLPVPHGEDAPYRSQPEPRPALAPKPWTPETPPGLPPPLRRRPPVATFPMLQRSAHWQTGSPQESAPPSGMPKLHILMDPTWTGTGWVGQGRKALGEGESKDYLSPGQMPDRGLLVCTRVNKTVCIHSDWLTLLNHANQCLFRVHHWLW